MAPVFTWKIGGRELLLDEPKIVGILNVTPDSFSDGGRFMDPEAALDRALQMAAEGAAMIDLGGESTRPGARAVEMEEEWNRIGVVLRGMVAKLSVPVSVDTRHGEVARRSLAEGAGIINDVSGGRDPDLLEVVAREGAGYVLMHMRGDPESMMGQAHYGDVLGEVMKELSAARDAALRAGIAPETLCLDPGFGFAKTPQQNYLLLKGLSRFTELGHPVMVGLSRKRMLRELVGGDSEDLKAASVTAALMAYTQGAHLFRVHDVRETRSLLKTFQELRNKLKTPRRGCS